MYNIRPMSFGEILDAGFRVLRDHFLLLVGIGAVEAVPVGLLMSFKSPNYHREAFIAGIVVALILAPVMVIAMVTAVASVYLDRPVTIGDAYRSVGGIFTPVIGTMLLADLLVVLGIIALVIPGIYFAIGWSLVFPVMIVEHRFGMTAMRRSRQLVGGAWWRTFGILLVAALIVRIPAAVLAIFWNFIPVLGPILTGVTTAIGTAYGSVVQVIYYLDRRCRIEDFDLRLLAEQIRAESPPVAAVVAQAAAPN